MSANKNDFKLSKEEYKNLRELVLGHEILTRLIEVSTEPYDDKFLVQLDHESVELLRDYLTEQLAIHGFDNLYSPTQVGKTLEHLIDIFYVK